ncbi:MAG: hypothetical protein H8E17_03150 [Deltaproteobacteria bacterium]|nr:hypothetical protein [Deltaproteobacteria bacterium]
MGLSNIQECGRSGTLRYETEIRLFHVIGRSRTFEVAICDFKFACYIAPLGLKKEWGTAFISGGLHRRLLSFQPAGLMEFLYF